MFIGEYTAFVRACTYPCQTCKTDVLTFNVTAPPEGTSITAEDVEKAVAETGKTSTKF